MRVIDAKVRNMRDELAKAGTPKDTDEVRISIDMDGLKSVKTLQPPNETQNSHKHLLAKEAIQLFDGYLEAYTPDTGWTGMKKYQVVEFGLNEYHNLRTGNFSYLDSTGKKLGAEHLAYRWVPPYISLEKGEAELLFNYDWFGEKFKDDPTNPQGSPLLRADRDVQKKFWKILERNKNNLDYDIESVDYRVAKKLSE